MKNNYPIKYVVIPIHEKLSSEFILKEYKRFYELTIYIVSKCHVLSEVKKYLADGSFLMNYKVHLPYENSRANSQTTWKRDDFNINESSLDVVTVENIFETFEEAEKFASKLNENAFGNIQIPFLHDPEEIYSAKFKRLEEEYNLTLSRCKVLEKMMDEKTTDLCFDIEPKEKSIICCYKDKDVIMPNDIYYLIRRYSDLKFYACNVSKEEYESMKEQIKSNGVLDERTSQSRAMLPRYLLVNDCEEEITRFSNYDSQNEKGCFYLCGGGYPCMMYDENMLLLQYDASFKENLPELKIYTTETYDDVIRSYAPMYDKRITADDIDAVVYKKTRN